MTSSRVLPLIVSFSSGPGSHRNLHSFPTRRSSDLAEHRCQRIRITPVTAIVDLLSIAGEQRRSEEHTSELQSLRHLVCRLLLEKKKSPARTEGAVDSGCRCAG